MYRHEKSRNPEQGGASKCGFGVFKLNSCGSVLAGIVAVTLSACGGTDWSDGVVPDATAGTVVTSDTISSSASAPKPLATPDAAQPTEVAASGPARSAAQGSVTSADWIDTLVSDMKLWHDGPVRTLDWLRGWGSGWEYPRIFPKPEGWTTAGPWGVIMADTDHPNGIKPPVPWRVAGPYTGNRAPNTRVQVRDMQLWWLMSNGQWVRGSYVGNPGGYMYHTSWKGEQTTSENAFRDESNNGGGKSARYINMNAPSSSSLQFDEWHWHFFGPRATAPTGYVGFATAYFARKILHDPNGVDDRANARLLADTAGDWWITATAQWDNFKTSGPMGWNRFKYLNNDWQMISFHSLTEAQIRANPPPIIGR